MNDPKFRKITEQPSLYQELEQMSTRELLESINAEDQKVATAVRDQLDSIEELVEAVYPLFRDGGRLFYIGAGTSGRLGVVDASEIPPTFGLPHERVIGLIAGGDRAIRKAVEFAEDHPTQAWEELKKYDIGHRDALIGIAASGTTPYVVGGVRLARQQGILTGCITNNPGSPLALAVEYPVVVEVGPEFVTGSTRMKSGTSQKLVLNMLTTSLMIRLGRVKGNRMVDMQLSNAKLVDRGTRYLVEALGIEYQEALALLEEYGSVRKAMESRLG